MSKPPTKLKKYNTQNKVYFYLTHDSKGIFLLCLLAVLLTIGSIVAYKHHTTAIAIKKEHAQFTQAEKDLDALRVCVVTKFGEPDDSQKDKSCSYTSNPNEFEKGDLVCSIAVVMVYPVSSKDTAKFFTNQVSDFAKTTEYLKFGSSSTALADTLPPAELKSESYVDEASGLDCSSSYTYYTSIQDEKLYGYPLLKSDQGLMAIFDCSSRPAKAAYYPIRS